MECAQKHMCARHLLQNIIGRPYCLFPIAIWSHETVYPTNENLKILDLRKFLKIWDNLCVSKLQNFQIFICGIYSLVREYNYGQQTIWSANDILERMTRAYMFSRALQKLLTSVYVFQIFCMERQIFWIAICLFPRKSFWDMKLVEWIFIPYQFSWFVILSNKKKSCLFLYSEGVSQSHVSRSKNGLIL